MNYQVPMVFLEHFLLSVRNGINLILRFLKLTSIIKKKNTKTSQNLIRLRK